MTKDNEYLDDDIFIKTVKSMTKLINTCIATLDRMMEEDKKREMNNGNKKN